MLQCGTKGTYTCKRA